MVVHVGEQDIQQGITGRHQQCIYSFCEEKMGRQIDDYKSLCGGDHVVWPDGMDIAPGGWSKQFQAGSRGDILV